MWYTKKKSVMSAKFYIRILLYDAICVKIKLEINGKKIWGFPPIVNFCSRSKAVLSLLKTWKHKCYDLCIERSNPRRKNHVLRIISHICVVVSRHDLFLRMNSLIMQSCGYYSLICFYFLPRDLPNSPIIAHCRLNYRIWWNAVLMPLSCAGPSKLRPINSP